MFKITQHCHKCHRIREQYEIFKNVIIDLEQYNEHNLDLRNCFMEHNTKRREKKYCMGCKGMVDANQCKELYKLPPILIIVFKRYSDDKTQKFEQHVEYPIYEFDISPYMAQNSHVCLKDTVYNLQSVICHTGGLHTGHYWALGRRADNNVWSSFGAGKTEIYGKELISSSAQILIYERATNVV